MSNHLMNIEGCFRCQDFQQVSVWLRRAHKDLVRHQFSKLAEDVFHLVLNSGESAIPDEIYELLDELSPDGRNRRRADLQRFHLAKTTKEVWQTFLDDYHNADQIYRDKYAKTLPLEDYQKEKGRFYSEHKTKAEARKKQLFACLEKNNLESADKLNEQLKNDAMVLGRGFITYNYPLLRMQTEKKRREQEKREEAMRQVAAQRDQAQTSIREILRVDFHTADSEYTEKYSTILSLDDYRTEKAEAIQRWLKESNNDNFGEVELNDEQALAAASLGDNLLIEARAGSGKTRVLTGIANLLLKKYAANPSELCAVAFNKKAAHELRNRLTQNYQIKDVRFARTFHSLAFHLCDPQPARGCILHDGDEGPLFTKFIGQTVKDALADNSNFKRQIYQIFREEMRVEEMLGAGLPPVQRMALIRNLHDTTLAGETVKSFGEKVIADFLFEHDVKYRYEDIVFWGGRIYRPDFKIWQGEGIAPQKWWLEHWALNPNDPMTRLPEQWDISAAQYRVQITDKREYWKEQKEPLLETHSGQLQNGRAAFETVLHTLFTNAGITLNRLDDEILADRVCKKRSSQIDRLFVQLVLRARKAGWDSGALKLRVEQYDPESERARLFLNMGVEVLQRYETRCKAQGKIDFDTLLERAAERIIKTNGECTIGTNSTIKVSDLKWLLMDEFQDFSPQFDRMVQAMRKTNTDLKVVSVGDDWQAINAFAGSELTYFNEFESRFVQGSRVSLAQNYRSASEIVVAGNQVMVGRGKPAEPATPKSGTVNVEDVSRQWIELRTGEEFQEKRKADEKYRFLDETGVSQDSGEMQARYLKFIHQTLVEQNLLGKSVAILSRIKRFYYLEKISILLPKLKSLFSPEEIKKIGDFDKKFSAGTIHDFKGKEAEVVFVVNVCQWAFPLVHSSEPLFRIFGRGIDEVLEEERRLFYVAVTRAKEHLWLLTEGDRPSDYLRECFPEKMPRLA